MTKRRRWLGPGLFLVVLAAFCASAATPKRVLILDSFGRDIAPFNAGTSAFRTTLARELGEPVDIHEASLDAARFAEPEKEGPFVEFLKSRFESHQLDLVVPIGAPAVRFMAKYRESLFAYTPVLFMATEPRLIPPALLQTNATLITQRVNLPGFVEDILQMRPDTTNIVVVIGASSLEKFWAGESRREFLQFTNRVGFTWLNDLSLDQMEQRVAALPPRSFVLFAMLVMDASGVPYDGNVPLLRLHEVAKAPIFAYFSSQFGSGAIGGRLYQDTEVGARAARTAIRILRGEKPEGIAPQILEAASPVYDWRELRRWNISEASLPVGSEVRFRQPSTWDEHKWEISGSAVMIVLEALLISALVVQRRRRRRAEAQARRQQEELAHITRVSTLAELATSVAHELNQPLGAILRNAEAAELFLQQNPPDYEEVRAILADIRSDDLRAGAVIDRTRTLLKKRDVKFEVLSLKELIDRIAALTHVELAARKVALRVNLFPDLRVRGDRVQLQQVLLNLLMNGADAMSATPREQRQLTVTVRRDENEDVEIGVSDRGHGIPADKLMNIFDSFFTTKANGLGMGLAISQTIVKAHGGRIWAENNSNGGATVLFTLKGGPV